YLLLLALFLGRGFLRRGPFGRFCGWLLRRSLLGRGFLSRFLRSRLGGSFFRRSSFSWSLLSWSFLRGHLLCRRLFGSGLLRRGLLGGGSLLHRFFRRLSFCFRRFGRACFGRNHHSNRRDGRHRQLFFFLIHPVVAHIIVYVDVASLVEI